ncbi:transcriptional regulator, GntR family protein [Stappia aggregata IAM 12614]|uniref:Transcriptional regulator, GntR family protein n=1 Tax=Roseibium aggregatum (strain ATCC 25650 / DSM 13394 / JCM 20685 / NBRC 16684 / NCIMB 2208 / IAM 12614 / B1) TaxID=384765 RepID=A0NQS0_ROSAI|nr:GntR family transcriptional regulator [Roseibium aggregatum]EAV45128.1 transcriptional regulator, GntR family protein [Stappia aggregata IAM 12614] [Roseibium aggregatum IAM 12614]
MTDQDVTASSDVADLLSQASSAQERFQIMYSVLRDRICMLVYPPGTQLSEEALASEFGVSRSPLRKALQILEADGLLLSQQGVGTLVTEVDLQELAQVYELRLELNELTGRLCPRPPDRELETLFNGLKLRAERLIAAPDRAVFARLNIDFFHAFQQLTLNVPLQDVSEKLFYKTCRIWLTLIQEKDLPQEVAIFCGEIMEIANAVRLGDFQAAALIRRAHLSMGFNRLKTATPQSSGLESG